MNTIFYDNKNLLYIIVKLRNRERVLSMNVPWFSDPVKARNEHFGPSRQFTPRSPPAPRQNPSTEFISGYFKIRHLLYSHRVSSQLQRCLQEWRRTFETKEIVAS